MTASTSASKTLRVSVGATEDSLDSALSNIESWIGVIGRVYEPMFEYDYLARPAKLVPRTLSAMPTVSGDGKTFVFQLQKGIYFSDDIAFQGKKRELVASDYAYSLKRIYDPKLKSPWYGQIEGKIVGADKLRAQAMKSGSIDLGLEISGIEVLDRYRLRIRLTKPDPSFLYLLALPFSGALARESVEFHSSRGSHQFAGTGAYMFARGEYRSASKVVLTANPNYRKRTWNWISSDRSDDAIVTAMAGKPVPSIQRIEISVIEEGQSAWLALLSGQVDEVFQVSSATAHAIKEGGTLKQEHALRGVVLGQIETLNTLRTVFNMNDPVVGGYSPAKIALRRAIQYCFPLDEHIRVVTRGDAIAASSIVPASLRGHIAAQTRFHEYNPALANALLNKYGYVDRDGDGFRELPDGKPLVLERITDTRSSARAADELWKKAMDAIGIKITFQPLNWTDMHKAALQGQIKMMQDGSTASLPDGAEFFASLYSGNALDGGSNYSRFKVAEYDSLYEQMAALPHSDQRDALIIEMEKIIRNYAPWIAPWHMIRYYATARSVVGL
ncbi:MAG: ABC transporter substrate-binding protein, partial [Casimicrobium sp.]